MRHLNEDATLELLALMEECEQSDRSLDPEDVVRFAADASTALHKLFEWDDTAAAHKYRLYQARGCIRCVAKIETNTEGEDVAVRAIVSVAPRQFHSLDYVKSNAVLRERLLENALRDLEVFRQKYQSLKELIPIWEAIQKVHVPVTVTASNVVKTDTAWMQ